MSKLQCLIYCLFLNILLARGQTYTSVIQTASGPLRGLFSTSIENLEYASFKGIPYAKPPVGYLRFKPPVVVDGWSEVYNATSEGSMCTQFDSSTNSAVGSEDCLYINVYTPHTQFNASISIPVMVWIYGGGFTTGYSNQSLYGPDFLVGAGVIVVTFNYRLGALGFLNLEHANATGNCGLKDQSFALRWVKKNIAQFGGNPNRITVFGQSAGSVSTDLQVLSDMSVGLFSQSISMSGATLNLWWGFQNRLDAVKKGFDLGSKLGTLTVSKDELLKTLYNASAAEIISASNDIGLLPFRPTLEKSNIAVNQEKFLTTCSVVKYITGNYTKGPHMMGFTADEALSFFGSLDDLLNMTNTALESLENLTGSIPFLSNFTNAISTGLSNLAKDAIYAFLKEATNFFYVLGIDTKQRLISRNNNYPIYYYRFSFTSNYSLHKAIGINLEGAGHADDVPYIFYAPIAHLPLNQSDIATTRHRMVKLYTNFAKYGNPTPDGVVDKILGITWPDSRPSGKHLEIGSSLTTGPRPTDNNVKALQLAGLGASPVLNDCTRNDDDDDLSNVISGINLNNDLSNVINGSWAGLNLELLNTTAITFENFIINLVIQLLFPQEGQRMSE